MIKFKLSHNPPPQSCLIGYYTGTRYNPDANVGFDDRSWEWPENRTGYEQVVRCHRYGTPFDPIGSGDVVVGNISARGRDLVDPVPLPWSCQLGDADDIREELLVWNPLIDGLDAITNHDEAVAELKRQISLINPDGSPSNAIWDLELVPKIAAPADDGKLDIGSSGPFGWRVQLYIDRQSTPDNPIIARYNAVRPTLLAGAADVLYNHEELLHPEPYLNGSVIEPGATIPGGDDYALELRDDSTFTMRHAGVVPSAMAIALWTDQSQLTWDVVAAGLNRDLVIWDDAAVAILGTVTNINDRTVREVVQSINRLNLAVRATCLLDYPRCELELSTNNAINQWGGNPLYMDNHLFVYYKNESKLYLEKPTDLESYEDWHCKVAGSPVRMIVDEPSSPLHGYELTYAVSESTWEPRSQIYNIANSYSYDYLESIDEPVQHITDDLVAVRNRGLLVESLRVLRDGADITHLVRDIDRAGGIIRLDRSVLEAELVTATYAYEPEKTTLDMINLNISQLHLPELYQLYIGVYVIPYKQVSPSAVVSTFSPNMGYVIANSVAEIETAIQNLVDAGSGLPMYAKLLGVFQTSSEGAADQVGILDVRTRGGGLREGVDLQAVFKRAPEAQFFADIGYVDGEPYPGQGVIIVQAPNRIFGSDPTPGVSPSDGGFVDRDGRESPDEVRDRVNRHVPIGSTGIIDNA